MDTQPNPELDMLEALLASMQHQNSGGQIYEDVDDDDDDEYDDDDEDEDEDGYYEHNIQTLLNPYGASTGDGGGEEMGNAGMQLPTMQTMNFLQGLLNMNNGSGLADIEAAIGESINGGMESITAPMENSSAANFLPAMQSLIPNISSDVAGALAGAFAGGMTAFTDYAHGGSSSHPEEFDDDEDALSDEDDDDDDEDDDDDDEDDDDEDEDDDESPIQKTNTHGISGGMMTAGMLVGAGIAFNQGGYQSSHPMQPHPHQMTQRLPSVSVNQVGFSVPMPLPIAARPTNALIPVAAANTTLKSSSLVNMSGGTVSRVDPLAALAGIGGLALGANILKPIMNTLGNSGGTTVITKMDNPNILNSTLGNSGGTTVITKMDNPNIATLVASSLVSSPSRTMPVSDMNGVITAISAAKLVNHYNHTRVEQNVRFPITVAPLQPDMQPNEKRLQLTKLECDDDKASLGSTSSAGSVTSGCGKSDTESVGKKTPTPGQDITDSNHGQGGSCASITDLASATESMRDSDTDNHSESHNITASLCDVDSEILEQHQRKLNELSHFQVGPIPIIIERPTYGWNSLVGLDTAKGALKNLFHTRTFPAVFDGSEGSCKGILLFGPSGSGKTTLSRALGKEASNALFVGINSSFLINSHPYEAIKLVRCMFEQARHQKPAVILFDDIDSLCCHPQIYKESAMRAKEEIMAQVKGMTTMQPLYPSNVDASVMNDGVLVLGTTNKPWLVEDRLRRLFAYNIHVKLPNDKERYTLFKAFLETLPNRISEPELACLISKSDGYSAAEINAIIRQTSHKLRLANPNTLDTPPVTYDDLATELTHFGSGYNEELKQKYSAYIRAATHRKEELEDSSKEKKDKPKGVKKFSQRIAKSIAAAVLAVID